MKIPNSLPFRVVASNRASWADTLIYDTDGRFVADFFTENIEDAILKAETMGRVCGYCLQLL